jgi:hypothetical protein
MIRDTISHYHVIEKLGEGGRGSSLMLAELLRRRNRYRYRP